MAWLALALLVLWEAGAPARAAQARIESLQIPAWVERGGAVGPARPGGRLDPGDRVRTGPGGRVLLRLPDGSDVRLGAEADFRVQALEEVETEGRGLLRGALDVLKGAFRYTSGLLRGARGRDLRIRVAAVTVGIRGTDVWGRSGPDRDFVVLIEGAIEVTPPAGQPLTLSEPRSVFSVPRGAAPEPVTRIDPEALARLARETEPAPAGGLLSREGVWTVHLAAYRTRAGAEAESAAREEAGVPVRVREARVGGASWYRVEIPGLASLAEARGLARRLGGGAWVSGP